MLLLLLLLWLPSSKGFLSTRHCVVRFTSMASSQVCLLEKLCDVSKNMCHGAARDEDLLYFLKRTDSDSVLAVPTIVNRLAYLYKKQTVPLPILSIYFVSGAG